MIRNVVEGTQVQGSDESISYNITTTNWGTNPSNVFVVLYDVTAPYEKVDVSSTSLTGNPQVSNDIITTPLVTDLVSGRRYRMEVKFSSGTSVFEALVNVECE